MNGTIADVHCPNCGAPARYDVVKRQYLCSYCGGKVEIGEAQAQKKGFRRLQQEKIRQSAERYSLMHASCTGCGASLIFPEGEAMADCAFCGRSLVRRQYLVSEELPELILPFRITRDEAADCLEAWCRRNSGKPEARSLRENLDRLEGFYLPYELIRGPVSCKVSRMDGGRIYQCGGCVENVFVNCSKQLDNLLLDGMEPYELEELKPFDFSYAAGQRIKTGDIDAGELRNRVREEVSNDYAPVVRATLETRAVEVETNADEALRMPVLLPVYFISSGNTLAAVNGQTGKVSVRAEKVSHYYFLPWWLKAILATLVTGGAVFGAMCFFGLPAAESLFLAGVLAIVLFIVTLCLYSDTVRNRFKVEAGRKIFTSSGGPFRRVEGRLVQDAAEITKQVTPPVFLETLDGRPEPVQLVFSSFSRRLKTAVLAVVVLFLPVIVALFLNGFDFSRLELGGSAAWFCLMVPLVPIYLLKFAVVERYDRPWIYRVSEDGRRKRYRKKTERRVTKDLVVTVLRVLFVPPVSLAVWFGILFFCVMCYLTAFGFD